MPHVSFVTGNELTCFKSCQTHSEQITTLRKNHLRSWLSVRQSRTQLALHYRPPHDTKGRRLATGVPANGVARQENAFTSPVLL